jgi:hypothetical protein
VGSVDIVDGLNRGGEQWKERVELRRLDVSVLEDIIASGINNSKRMLLTGRNEMMKFLSVNESVRVTENTIGRTEKGRR